MKYMFDIYANGTAVVVDIQTITCVGNHLTFY